MSSSSTDQSIRRRAGAYAIVVGALLVVMWGVLLGTGRGVAVADDSTRLLFHLLAEAITAVSLVTGGIGLVNSAPWARGITLLGLGMLTYTVVASPAFYAEAGSVPVLGMLAALVALALAAVRPLLVAGE